MAQRLDIRRIGLLVPSSSSVQEWDIGRALPDDITLHVARMRLSNVDAESTLRIVQEIETESQKLADVDVDVIIFPATAPSSRNGIGYDQELIKRISAASGKPATTASTALLEALHVLSVKQIVLGAPWSASINQTVAAFIEANGVKVLAQEALGLISNLEIGLLDFPCEVEGRTVLLCWKLGEKGITHWHDTSEGFAGRKPIDERIAKAKRTN